MKPQLAAEITVAVNVNSPIYVDMTTFVPCFNRCRMKLSIIDVYVSAKSAMTTFMFDTGSQ